MKFMRMAAVICGSLFLCGKQAFAHNYEQPIVVIIPSYNNGRLVEENLSSVFMQQYTNYRVIYVADHPSDNTVAEVIRVVAKYQQEDRFTLIVNDERCGAMANWYTTIHSCDDEAIIVQVDGDDRLYNAQVLSYINKVYAERDVWLTYGQFIDYPSNVIGYEYSKPFSEKVIANNAFRKVEQLPMSHLRTCKAWLFKAIKLEDTLYQEQFYPMTCDKLMLACMIEMAARHHYRVPDVLYVYNNTNALCDHRINMQLQHSLAWHILSLPPYKQLDKPVYVEQFAEDDRATAIIVCSDATSSISSMQESINHTIRGLHRLIFLVPAEAINALSLNDSSVTIIAYELGACGKVLKELVQKLDDRYILLATDKDIVAAVIDMTACIRMLKKTQTNLFYLGLGNQAQEQTRYRKKLPLINRDHTIAAWYASSKNGNWIIPTLGMTVWCRDLLFDALQTINATAIDQLEQSLDGWLMQKNVLGLLFNEKPVKGH